MLGVDCTVNGVIDLGLTHKLTFEQRFEGRERVSMSISLEKGILEIENSQYKVLKDKTYLI